MVGLGRGRNAKMRRRGNEEKEKPTEREVQLRCGKTRRTTKLLMDRGGNELRGNVLDYHRQLYNTLQATRIDKPAGNDVKRAAFKSNVIKISVFCYR